MPGPLRNAYTVMCRSGGLLARKDSRWNTEAGARARAAQIMREGWTDTVYVWRHFRGAGAPRAGYLVATYTDGYTDDVTERYQRSQAIPLVLPPPSPLDDLGEEE